MLNPILRVPELYEVDLGRFWLFFLDFSGTSKNQEIPPSEPKKELLRSLISRCFLGLISRCGRVLEVLLVVLGGSRLSFLIEAAAY